MTEMVHKVGGEGEEIGDGAGAGGACVPGCRCGRCDGGCGETAGGSPAAGADIGDGAVGQEGGVSGDQQSPELAFAPASDSDGAGQIELVPEAADAPAADLLASDLDTADAMSASPGDDTNAQPHADVPAGHAHLDLGADGPAAIRALTDLLQLQAQRLDQLERLEHARHLHLQATEAASQARNRRDSTLGQVQMRPAAAPAQPADDAHTSSAAGASRGGEVERLSAATPQAEPGALPTPSPRGRSVLLSRLGW